jgi:hypothetical protein
VVSDALDDSLFALERGVALEVFAAQELGRLDVFCAPTDTLASVAFVDSCEFLRQVSPDVSARFDRSPEVLWSFHDALLAMLHFACCATECGGFIRGFPLSVFVFVNEMFVTSHTSVKEL